MSNGLQAEVPVSEGGDRPTKVIVVVLVNSGCAFREYNDHQLEAVVLKGAAGLVEMSCLVEEIYALCKSLLIVGLCDGICVVVVLVPRVVEAIIAVFRIKKTSLLVIEEDWETVQMLKIA
jgi:hypothetical protein